jgi:hypothetical protein
MLIRRNPVPPEDAWRDVATMTCYRSAGKLLSGQNAWEGEKIITGRRTFLGQAVAGLVSRKNQACATRLAWYTVVRDNSAFGDLIDGLRMRFSAQTRGTATTNDWRVPSQKPKGGPNEIDRARPKVHHRPHAFSPRVSRVFCPISNLFDTHERSRDRPPRRRIGFRTGAVTKVVRAKPLLREAK